MYHHYQHHHHAQQAIYPPPQHAYYPPQQPRPAGPAAMPPPGPAPIQQQQSFNYAPPSVQQPQPQAPPQQSEEELRAWFKAVDSDNTGDISPANLQQALSTAGFRFRAGTAEKLVKMFDRTGRNAVQFQDFAACHAFIQSMAHGFSQRDADRSGVLDSNEVRAALAASGFRLSEPAHQLIMKKFGRQGGGGVQFDDYIDLSIILGTSAKVFAFYDASKSGLVTFDYSTWLVSVLACLI
jgi:Ca2+-binding EF-hand superfamily protein